MVKDTVLQRINRNVHEDIKYYRDWLIASSNKDITMSFSKTLESMVRELMIHHEIKKEINKDTNVKIIDNMLKSNRIDNNFNDLTRRKSEITRNFLKREGITPKKLSTSELHDMMIEQYVIKQYPELGKLINQFKLIQREPRIEEMRKTRGTYKDV